MTKRKLRRLVRKHINRKVDNPIYKQFREDHGIKPRRWFTRPPKIHGVDKKGFTNFTYQGLKFKTDLLSGLSDEDVKRKIEYMVGYDLRLYKPKNKAKREKKQVKWYAQNIGRWVTEYKFLFVTYYKLSLWNSRSRYTLIKPKKGF